MLYGQQTKEGLDYLNSLRTATGLIVFKQSSTLAKAAKSHAKYLIQNQTYGHYEKKGKYSYTGKTPSLRVKKAGYPSTVVMENLSINTTTQKKAIDNLFAAIYHRFTFLNLYADTIGIGIHSTKKKRAVKQAYVYNLASSELMKLCLQPFTMKNGQYYMQDVCKKSDKMIPQSIFNAKKKKIKRKNKKIVIYPYDGQKGVPPAFYNESPDPLPKYKVSGFPISLQFNTAFFKKVKFKSFRLYDAKGNQIIKTKILRHSNDPHHLLGKFEFALMPLARLEFSHKYKAVFKAIVDGKSIEKEWTFETLKPKEKVYRVSKVNETLEVKAGSTILLYMVPSHRKDLLINYRMKGGAKAVFIDQNTLRVTFPKRKSSGKVSLRFGNKKRVKFIVK